MKGNPHYERFRPKEGMFLTEGGSFIHNKTGDAFDALVLRPDENAPPGAKSKFLVHNVTHPGDYLAGLGYGYLGTSRFDFKHYRRTVAFAGLARADDAKAFEQGDAHETFKRLADSGRIVPLKEEVHNAAEISKGGRKLVLVFEPQGMLKKLRGGKWVFETHGRFLKRVVSRQPGAFVSPLLKLPKAEPHGKMPHR